MIVFCTTCKGRTQHLRVTLPKNLEDNRAYQDCKFVVVDYNSQDDMRQFLENQDDVYIRRNIEIGRLVVYSYPRADRFRMAHAKNMSHRCGLLEGGTLLCNLDADNYTGENFANYINNEFISSKINGNKLFLWSKMIKDGENRLDRGISGRIVVSDKAFIMSGGYDEQFDTWSPDDKDFNLRLRRLGYNGKEIDVRYLSAVRHNNKMRFKEYPHVQNDLQHEDDFHQVADSETTIANFGKIGCGTVYKNYDYRNPIELGPIPTRIFGIGMHKTATTSLHAAFRILGYDSGHWEDAHWAKSIFVEIMGIGKSLTLEKFYALSDLPITILYEKLDKAYPGSKFILTVRDEKIWIESVRKHWSHEHNPFRNAWATDPFTHLIHRELYGTKGFDENIMLTRYRKHNAEVQQYFHNRPNDLLIMDMDKNAGWLELCKFLGKPIPQERYPRLNAVKK